MHGPHDIRDQGDDMSAKRSVRTQEGRQRGMRLTWTDTEHAWLQQRAAEQGVSMARLIRRGIARDAMAEGDTPPSTLCTADDYSEGVCAR